jgi:Domain of unknown function (DUF4129)
VLGSAGVSLAATDRDGSAGARSDAQRRGDEIDEAREAVIDSDYQTRMPDDTFERAMARHRDDSEERERDKDDTRLRLEVRRSSVMRLVVWGLVIVAGGLGVVWLASALRRGREHAIPAPVARARPTAAILDKPLDDADELARGGAYGDAIHTLLLRTLHELARSAEVRVAPAMTSREILARVGLADDARDALANLIGAVEVTHFRGDAADAADYDRCRDQFHRFARAFRGVPA